MGNHDLLTKILRDDWGYKGIVMTDWIGIRDGLPTITEVHAGNDLMEPGQPAQVQEIIAGVKNGKLSIADVDRNVRRMLEYIVKTPSFRQYPASNNPDFKAHAGKLEKPTQELKAFAKTRELKPGESQTLTMTIPVRDLASFDETDSQWLTEAGTYSFRLGFSSRDIKATAQLKLAEYTEKTTNALAPKQKLNLLKQ